MTTKETAFKKISELIERFTDQYDSYKKSDYNETLTRRDFIDPLFKALGWDIDNSQGYAEAYREVVHEDKIKIAGVTKAPDYSFKLPGGKRLFFLEAKKPSILVKEDMQPAYQIRSYAYSSAMPISIITDFEEFAIYDCTKKPFVTDKASVGRIRYLTFKDYIKEFDFLWDTFSKERVLKGGFDKFIQSDTAKKGTATVDKDFLQSLDEWRSLLATTISKNNLNLDEDELNFVLQQTLDRIIFLRIAEDRGVEPYGNLKNALKHGTFYNNAFDLFRQADEKYNSGLFDFKKDKISRNIILDNKTLKTIIEGLYFPISPFRFAVMPVEIMGSAYEQFLGKQITLDKNHKVHIDEKPEVRKAGGVYYTPQYIVDYIVTNTIGRIIKGLKPKDITKIKIIDPACGSGSFLLGAFQCLLDYHKNFYTERGKNIKGKDKPLTPDGDLTTAEKKRILLNNIFGVDLDTNAVEVTKLSLLLKCMEGETEASIAMQLKLFNDRVLPTLDENIKSGNSLIDTDFYDSTLDFGDEKKIKPFNWNKSYQDVFKQGGFDIVIGNPPYVMLQNLETREVFDYALSKFASAKYKIDTYQLFIERSIKLLKGGGLLGFITPNTFLKNIHAEPLRKFILENTIINEILLFKYSVFAAVSVDTCVFIFESGIASKKSELTVNMSEIPFEVIQNSKVKQSSFSKNNRTDFNLLISDNDSELLIKISKKSRPLSAYCKAYFGIQTCDRDKYVSEEKKNRHFEPIIDGWNIEPYYLKPSKEYVNYIPSAIKSGGNEAIYRQDRICIRQIGLSPISTFVKANIFTLNTIYNVYLKEKGIANLKFLLGVINSKTTRYFWRKNNSDEKKTFPKIKKEAILSIPIPETDNEKSLHDEIVKLVDQVLKMNEEKISLRLQTKLNQLQAKVEYCEGRINEIVYQLYGLAEEEIKMVEAI